MPVEKCEVCGNSYQSPGMHICKGPFTAPGPTPEISFSINDMLKFRDEVGRHLASITIALSEGRNALLDAVEELKCLRALGERELLRRSRKPKVRRKRQKA